LRAQPAGPGHRARTRDRAGRGSRRRRGGGAAPTPPSGRNLLVFTALLALLGGGLWYGWSVIQSNYYVGATEEGEIAVFRGVPGRVAGLELSSYHSGSGTDIE